MHRITDIYGPVIYSNFGNEDSKLGSAPDTQQEAYRLFFKDLDEGITEIKNFIASEEYQIVGENFQKFDALMPDGKKTYSQWIKFANSLRLRLALRIVNVDPRLSHVEVTKALADEGGLLEASEDMVAVSTASGYLNPLGVIAQGWKDVFMNANMESIMNGYKDPRLEKYFKKATGHEEDRADYPYKDTYKGIRQGTGFQHSNYSGHSLSTVTEGTNAILMTAAEVWFLRAEAAWRWGTEVKSAEECYKQGIKSSFTQWGLNVEVDAYFREASKPIAYKDAFDDKNDVETPAETITPNWEDDNNDGNFARIQIQKWIACYPEGCEGWANQRRTGYPRLFPVLLNESKATTASGDIDDEKGARRLNFPVGLKTSNPDQLKKLEEALLKDASNKAKKGNGGGEDNCASTVWWDTEEGFLD
jgi:hypothetical protein